MELNEIKKLLYKKNPPAIFQYLKKGILYYSCNFIDYDNHYSFYFNIPIADTGEAAFKNTEEAKLLIRWIQV